MFWSYFWDNWPSSIYLVYPKIPVYLWYNMYHMFLVTPANITAMTILLCYVLLIVTFKLLIITDIVFLLTCLHHLQTYDSWGTWITVIKRSIPNTILITTVLILWILKFYNIINFFAIFTVVDLKKIKDVIVVNIFCRSGTNWWVWQSWRFKRGASKRHCHGLCWC